MTNAKGRKPRAVFAFINDKQPIYTKSRRADTGGSRNSKSKDRPRAVECMHRAEPTLQALLDPRDCMTLSAAKGRFLWSLTKNWRVMIWTKFSVFLAVSFAFFSFFLPDLRSNWFQFLVFVFLFNINLKYSTQTEEVE